MSSLSDRLNETAEKIKAAGLFYCPHLLDLAAESAESSEADAIYNEYNALICEPITAYMTDIHVPQSVDHSRLYDLASTTSPAS